MNIVHYPLADIELLDASYLLEAMKFIIPFVTFVIAAYAVTSLMDGEVKMQELFLHVHFVSRHTLYSLCHWELFRIY